MAQAEHGRVGACLALGEEKMQIAGSDNGLFRQDDGALQHILQLPHIARPVVVQQHLHGVVGDSHHRLFHFGAEAGDKGFRQDGDVFLALSKGRDVNRDDIEAIEQVLPKFALLDGGE